MCEFVKLGNSNQELIKLNMYTYIFYVLILLIIFPITPNIYCIIQQKYGHSSLQYPLFQPHFPEISDSVYMVIGLLPVYLLSVYLNTHTHYTGTHVHTQAHTCILTQFIFFNWDFTIVLFNLLFLKEVCIFQIFLRQYL